MIRNENVDFSAAEIRVIVHATEEKDKILEHLNRTLSVSPNSFSITMTEGHWGNNILVLNGILNKKEANSLYIKVKSSLSKNYHELLSNFFDEKGNLYVRLDKQRLCRGKVSLSDGDSVRIKFRPVLTHESRKSVVE
jgi:RNA binding exosome subunit